MNDPETRRRPGLGAIPKANQAPAATRRRSGEGAVIEGRAV